MVDKQQKLTQEQLNTVIEFANGLYQGVDNYGFFNPFTQNNNLLGLNGKSTSFTKDELIKALESSPYDYKKLAEYSSFYETFDTIYSKTLRYFIGLLSFDLTWSCVNVKDPKEYASTAYQQDLKRLYKFFDRFDYKQEFKKVVNLMGSRDVVYTWFRDTQDINSPIDIEDTKTKKAEHFALQIMPQDICTLTGYFNNSQLLYDMDMNYFLQSNVDLKLYSPAIRKMLKNAYDSKDNYNPSISIEKRNGSFANFAQANPHEGAYAFKFNQATFAQKPPFANLLMACLDNEVVSKLQMDKNMVSAWYLLAGEIGLLTNSKTDKSDQFAISPKTMGQFMSLVNSGIQGNVKPILMPAQNIRGWKFDDQNPSMYKNQLLASASQGASASDLIYADANLSQFAMSNAIQTDYNFIKQIYNQFAQFLNFYVNKKTVKYKFNFHLDGLDRDWYKQSQLDNMLKIADKGLTLPPQYFASALGYSPQDFARALEEAHYGSIVNNLTMLMNANTMKNEGGASSEGGRPSKDLSDKKDTTEVNDNYDN